MPLECVGAVGSGGVWGAIGGNPQFWPAAAVWTGFFYPVGSRNPAFAHGMPAAIVAGSFFGSDSRGGSAPNRSRRPVLPELRYDCFQRGEIRMNTLAGIIGIAYLLAFAFAVYDRLPISDWLASHLPL